MYKVFRPLPIEDFVHLLSMGTYVVRRVAEEFTKEFAIERGAQVRGVRLDAEVMRMHLDLHEASAHARAEVVMRGLMTFDIQHHRRDHAPAFPLGDAEFEVERARDEPLFRRLRMYQLTGGRPTDRRLLAEFIHQKAVAARSPARQGDALRTEILAAVYDAAIEDIDLSPDEVVIRLEGGRMLRIGYRELGSRVALNVATVRGSGDRVADGTIVDG